MTEKYYNKKCAGNSQLKQNAACMTLQCQVCFQSFMGTQIKMAKIHYDQKHSDKDWTVCFPNHDKPA